MPKAWTPCEKDKELIKQFFKICADSPSGLAWREHKQGRDIVGYPALSTLQSNGKYYRGNFTGISGKPRQLLAHRVIYFLHTGEWPTGIIDHIDGDRFNNNPRNLRDVSFSENAINTDSRGYRYRTDTKLPWELQVQFEGVRYIPRFATEEEAIMAVRKIKAEVATRLHGKFRWSNYETDN